MTTDIILDRTTHDIIIDNQDLTLFTTEEELTTQRVKINLLNFKGEWFRDINAGVPYLQSIFGKRGTQTTATSFLKNTIVQTLGIESITAFEYELDNNRNFKVVFSAITSSGTILENITVEI